MIRGKISPNLDVRVPLVLHARRRSTRIRAVVDTGFSEFLALSRRHRRSIAARALAKSLFELADGRKVEETTYLAEVSFDGKRREIVFHFTDSADSLIGASLLKEKRLDLRYRRRRVTIRDDP